MPEANVISYDFIRAPPKNPPPQKLSKKNNSEAVHTMFSDLARLMEEQDVALAKQKESLLNRGGSHEPSRVTRRGEESVVNEEREPETNVLKFLSGKAESNYIEKFARQVAARDQLLSENRYEQKLIKNRRDAIALWQESIKRRIVKRGEIEQRRGRLRELLKTGK